MRVHSFCIFIRHKIPMGLDIILLFYSISDVLITQRYKNVSLNGNISFHWQSWIESTWRVLRRRPESAKSRGGPCCKLILGGARWGSGTRNAFWAATLVWVVHEVGTRREDMCVCVCVCVCEREIGGRPHEKWGCSCGLVPDIWGSSCLVRSLDLFSEGVFMKVLQAETIYVLNSVLGRFCLLSMGWIHCTKMSLARRSPVISALVHIKGDGDLN